MISSIGKLATDWPLREVVDGLDALDTRATRLLYDFMKHQGSFELGCVEVLESPDDDGASFAFRYFFTADADANDIEYTYFDGFFSLHEPPQDRFWPFKFTVGFH